jgi:hypothetical protein
MVSAMSVALNAASNTEISGRRIFLGDWDIALDDAIRNIGPGDIGGNGWYGSFSFEDRPHLPEHAGDPVPGWPVPDGDGRLRPDEEDEYEPGTLGPVSRPIGPVSRPIGLVSRPMRLGQRSSIRVERPRLPGRIEDLEVVGPTPEEVQIAREYKDLGLGLYFR